MASTSLAQQLRKLAAPQTSLLIQKKKRPSLLFDPSEAAAVDRVTFYEIGISGLNELKEINVVFEEFRESLFDESSKNFERAVETEDVNDKLNAVIKKFLYLLSPYFLLKPTQKALEWLIVRFHIHEYNADELLCSALPYHGTRLFARLIQVLDLKNFHEKWQWLYPLQKKGVPLSKTALFNHCASDIPFFKMICEFTMDAVNIYSSNAFKLTTLFGFFSTTVIGTIQNLSEITELHVMHLLPSVLHGLTIDCVDYCASSFMIIAAVLTKTSFQENLLKKLVEKITKVKHSSLRTSLILLLNIIYQSQELQKVTLSARVVKNLVKSADWFVPTLGNFISSRICPNTFYLLLIRDTLNLIHSNENSDNTPLLSFVQNLLQSCRVNDKCAEKLIKIIINESKKYDDNWCCELVQNLEKQYPTAWDSVISTLFNEQPSESLSRILGFTSVTTQIQTFEKLNHANAVIRREAIKYIAKNPEDFKITYIESSLKARWYDEDPNVVKAMFSLPEKFRFCSSETYEKLLLKCWNESNEDWNSLLLKITKSLKSEAESILNPTKKIVLLLPFLISSSSAVQTSIFSINSKFIQAVRNKLQSTVNIAVNEVLKDISVLPSVDELIAAYDELPKENVYLFTILLLLSGLYTADTYENKSKILSFVFEQILPFHFKNLKWKSDLTWEDKLMEEYYKKTIHRIPTEIIYKFFISVIEFTSLPQQFFTVGWWDFSDEHSSLIALLYKYLNHCPSLNDDNDCNIFIMKFIQKHFNTLSCQIYFLCNMCVVNHGEPLLQIHSFKMMNSLLKNSQESYAWTLSLKSENIIVPCILICLHSEDLALRKVVIDTAVILSTSLGLAFTDEVTYVELVKYLLQYAEEIILDRQQLPSKIYMFLSQDTDVQSLLPTSIRFFTKSIHDAIFECITNKSTPVPVTASLLPVVNYLRDLHVILKLIPVASSILHSCDYPNKDSSFIVCNIIDKLHTNENVFEKDEVFEFIDYCSRNCSKIKIRSENGVCCLGTILLRKLSIDIFDTLSRNMQQYLLEFVLKVCSRCENIDLVTAANRFVKKITLNCELVVCYLKDMKNVNIKKSKHKSTAELTDMLEKTEWLNGIALLELIQNKKKIYNCQLIIPLLFDILQKCCEVDDHMPVEYAKQVCLSCILNCSQKLVSESNSNKIEKLFNVELIVNCIRMSPNPQTHHHALLLLAHCATFASNQVLHNIMAIFTFMGSSILRQDDAFSFQIISNILETIVPLLVKDKDMEFSLSAIISVLRVFAASIPDIPDHRRLPLLVKLMKILRNGEYVHILLILAVECCTNTSLNNKSISAKYVEVLQALLLLLPIRISLSSFEKLLEFANNLPHNFDDKKNEKVANNELFDLKKHTNKELCHFKYLLLNFISTTLSGNKFISQISVVSFTELKLFEQHFKGIIEHTLLYVKSVTDYSASLKNVNTKYWKVMISQALEILNKTNGLLTCETFLTVIRELLHHECLTVQRKSMELLNWRLQQVKDGALKDEFSSKELTSLLPFLMKMVSTISNNGEDDSFDLKLNQQTALISIKLIIKYCNPTDFTKKFKKILLKLSELLCDTEKMNDHVLACLVLCIAELTSSLKIQAIEFLPKFLPAIINLFNRYEGQDIPQNDIILLSIITGLQKIVETLPNFLSPYLDSILFEIARLTAEMQKNESKENKSDDIKHSTITHKLKLIRHKISSEVPARVLLPAISASFGSLSATRNFDGIKPLLNILADSFPKNSQFSAELTSLFLTMLDFRCTATSCVEEEILLVEQYTIDALCNIVLKCSETTFRPFYHKLYDWGIITSKEESKKDRILTYYRILCSISENLKSIFVLFASNFIRNAAELLDKNNISKNDGKCKIMHSTNIDKTVLLVDSVLKTLHNIFKYDTVKFLTKDRFNMLVEPLVNQIENTIGNYEKRSAEIIIPCLSRFAAATLDDSLWKQFNYLLLLKTRHSSPEIRLTALETVCMFATHIGDNFLPFLPETVPFLAELLEDEIEVVEKQTHKAVQRLEHILGEPIQKYF